MKSKLRLILVLVVLLAVLLGFYALAGRFDHTHIEGGGCCQMPQQAEVETIV